MLTVLEDEVGGARLLSTKRKPAGAPSGSALYIVDKKGKTTPVPEVPKVCEHVSFVLLLFVVRTAALCHSLVTVCNVTPGRLAEEL